MVTYNNKHDFIKEISKMTNKELNDFIKANGSPPKRMQMVRMIEGDKLNKNSNKGR